MAKGSRSKPLRTREVEWEGEKYTLATIGRGRNVPDKEKVKIARLVCEIYATDRYTLMDSLKYCGISSDNTFYAWCEEIPEVNDLFIEAQKSKDFKYRARIRERALTMFEKAIEGFTMELETTEIKSSPGGDGKEAKVKEAKKQKKQVYIRPVYAAIFKALENNTFFNSLGTNIPDGKSGMDSLSDQELEDRYNQLISEDEDVNDTENE